MKFENGPLTPSRGAKIVMAKEEDRDEILALYREQVGQEFCPWSEEYPSNDTIDYDLSRDALFVMKSEGRIIATISLDEDEEVNSLTCWDDRLAPEGELSRLAVARDMQNKGLARIMLNYGMEELKRRGCRGIHILVGKHNTKALRSYAVFGFRKVGECHLFGEDFYCFEKEF